MFKNYFIVYIETTIRRVIILDIEDILYVLNKTIINNQNNIFKKNTENILKMIDCGVSIERIAREFELEVEFIIKELEKMNVKL